MTGQKSVVIATPPPREMAFLAQAKEALAVAKTMDDVKKIRDKAESIRAYLQKQGYGVEIQNEGAELKIRAERRLGELMPVKPKQGKRSLALHDATLKRDLSTERSQAHRWRKVASVPEVQFEDFVAEARNASRELTTVSVVKLAKKIQAAAVDDIEQPRSEQSSGKVESFAGQKFGCIYADPAWKYGNQGTRAATDTQYPTMTVDEICALPIGELAAEDSHLHLWTTNAFLFEAKRVMEAWGFEYKSVRLWIKPQMGIGNYWRVSHEFLLFGIRGSAPFRDRGMMSWVNAKRTGHSVKPECFREDIEKVSPGPYLELFARREVPGWSSWGNQIEKNLYSRS